jgi:hypothetical protein
MKAVSFFQQARPGQSTTEQQVAIGLALVSPVVEDQVVPNHGLVFGHGLNNWAREGLPTGSIDFRLD